MNNPFDLGEIKNYLLFYAGVVAIMILFFIAATLFHENILQERKFFDTNSTSVVDQELLKEKNESATLHPFKLMEKAY